MKKMISFLKAILVCVFSIFSCSNLYADEFDVWITGPGITSLTATAGEEYTYTLNRTVGYPQELVKDLVWTVQNGTIIGANTGTLSVKVKWTPSSSLSSSTGTITVTNVYKDLDHQDETVTATLYFSNPEPPSYPPTLTCSTTSPIQFEIFSCTAAPYSGKEFESITWSGDDLVIKSGQGTNTMTGYFTGSGTKKITCEVKYKGDSKTYKESKNLSVGYLGFKIVGPNLICPNSSDSYTVENIPQNGQIVWSVADGLSILSGQNTSTVTVKSLGLPNFSKLTASVMVDGAKLTDTSLDVRTNTPFVESVQGPTGNVARMGEQVGFFASPLFAPDVCEYEWFVGGPEPYSIVTSSNVANITFYNTGTYNVGCRTKDNPCTASQAPVFVTITVVSSRSVSYNASTKVIEVKSQENAPVERIDCELYNATTGVRVLDKEVNSDDGTISVGNISNGIYILKIKDKVGVTSHKIQIK